MYLVVHPPCDRIATTAQRGWRRKWKGTGWRRNDYGSRNIVVAGKTGSRIWGQNARRIGDLRGQPKRTILVEGIDDAFAEMVVVHAETAANRSFASGAE